MAYCKNRLECKDFNPAGCGTLGVPEQCFNSKNKATESTTHEVGVERIVNWNATDCTLMHGDCLRLMFDLPDNSVDMVCCDMPYGQTQRNKWDTVLPLDMLWYHYNRIVKDNGVIVLFANGLFTVDLIMSNRKGWKYNMVWDKVLASGHLNAKKMPMRQHEDICVFYTNKPTYNPQMVKGKASHSVGSAEGKLQEEHSRNTNYGAFVKVETKGTLKYPKSILHFQKPHPSKTIHPTQKPVDLIENIIMTYTDKGDTVLDNCMGSGTTGVGCKKLMRKFVGMEKESGIFTLAENRIHSS